MSFEIGTILCIKTTGERVNVLSKSGNENAEMFNVRRAVIKEGGAISHVEETVNGFELETIDDHAERQVNEMILKSKSQVRLMKVEQKLQTEFEQDNVLTMPAKPKPSDPSVN